MARDATSFAIQTHCIFHVLPHPPALGQFDGCSEEDCANDENDAEEAKVLKVRLFSFPREQRHHLRNIFQSANDKFRTTL